MILSQCGSMVVENRPPGIRVARFIRPDLRDQLYDEAQTERCSLFQDFQASVLADFGPGETLVLNLGLVEPFSTEMYKCLLKVRQGIQARRGRIVLCGLNPQFREIFALFKASCLFEMAATETQALKIAAYQPGR